MAENSNQDDAARQTPPDDLAGERAKFEKERMNRRAALRRFGIGAGATAFLALGVDDLARLVLAKMQERHVLDNVTEQIARELNSAGVSFATDPVTCAQCDRQFCASTFTCVDAMTYCFIAGFPEQQCEDALITCNNDTRYAYNQCHAAHCPPRHPFPDCAASGGGS